MSLDSVMPALERYAIVLTKWHPEEDYRDLVHDTVVKLLNATGTITEAYAIVACKNTWRDRLAYKAVRNNIKYLEDMPIQPFGYLPQIEVDIYCQEVGININEYSPMKRKVYKANKVTDPIKLAIKREHARKRSQRWRAHKRNKYDIE